MKTKSVEILTIIFLLTSVIAACLYLQRNTEVLNINIGLVRGNQSFVRKAKIFNSSDVVIKINYVKASCGCVTIKSYPKTLNPYSVGVVELEVTINNDAGDLNASVLVGGDKNFVRKIQVNGFAVPDIGFFSDQKSINFGVYDTSSVSNRFSLTGFKKVLKDLDFSSNAVVTIVRGELKPTDFSGIYTQNIELILSDKPKNLPLPDIGIYHNGSLLMRLPQIVLVPTKEKVSPAFVFLGKVSSTLQKVVEFKHQFKETIDVYLAHEKLDISYQSSLDDVCITAVSIDIANFSPGLNKEEITFWGAKSGQKLAVIPITFYREH